MKESVNHSWYEAFKSKDVRFDGKIYVGVSSTSIYCRPVCKAKLPKEENCTYYSTPAEAERDGYRPCLMCRPELAPGNSPIDSSKTLAERAIKLIEENIGNEKSMQDITNELGCTDRHIRRVIKEEYNVSPIQYLQTCRLLLAKNLLTETNLSILNVAMASGFESLRQFNTTFKKCYKLNPSGFRKQLSNKKNRNGKITLSLGYRPPYRWKEILHFLAKRAIHGIERIENDRYCRTLKINNNGIDKYGWIEVANNDKKNVLEVSISETLLSVIPQVLSKIRKMFDLYCEPYIVYEGLKSMNEIKEGSCVLGTRIPRMYRWI